MAEIFEELTQIGEYLVAIFAQDDEGVVSLPVGLTVTQTTAVAQPDDGERCFVATAAYGTPLANELQTLRHFRDTYLLTNPGVSACVDTYYRLSPTFSRILARHESLKAPTRLLISSTLGSLKKALNEAKFNQRKAADLLELTYHQFRGLYRKYQDDIGD